MSLENKDEDLSPKLESKLKHPSKTPLKKSSTSSKNLKQVNFLSSSPKKQAKNSCYIFVFYLIGIPTNKKNKE